jgi:hypothetical protein
MKKDASQNRQMAMRECLDRVSIGCTGLAVSGGSPIVRLVIPKIFAVARGFFRRIAAP